MGYLRLCSSAQRPLFRAQRLLQYVEDHQSLPTQQSSEVVAQYGCDLGMFWKSVKGGQSKALYETLLSTNKVLREDMERVQKKRKAQELQP